MRWSAVLAATFVTLLSPHYAWYFVWVLVPAALTGSLPMLWLPLAATLLYWPDPDGSPVWVGAVIYGGFLLWSAIEIPWRRKVT